MFNSRGILCLRRSLMAVPLTAVVMLNTAQAQRQTILLDGTWMIGDSVSPEDMPQNFTHSVPVPGLVHSAEPPFPGVDRFQSRELMSNLAREEKASAADLKNVGNKNGTPGHQRNYFWYSRDFKAPPKRAVALIKINKAQFGIAVYLNGEKLGEHLPCFTAAYVDASHAIRWGAKNQLIIRVGAHPGVLPANVSAGTDFEKKMWTPGIYDDVSLLVMDDPAISAVQVAPRIESSVVVVQTELRNHGPAHSTVLQQQIREWKGARVVATAKSQEVLLKAGETRTIVQTIRLPRAHLWSPEDPFLYLLESHTTGDSAVTRFGMREFRFDTTTQRAYLNGKPYFLRGSNITLHRFFEDPESGVLTWDNAWLHKLLVEIPKQVHWNSFRFCIGPVPDRWLEIADEAGLLIQNEYMVFTGHPSWNAGYTKRYDTQEMIGEFREWMRDNWNHPSVAIWDANNESWAPEFGKEIIPAVRAFDLSHRPWENSYNPPAAADDPVEDHPYLWMPAAFSGALGFHMSDLENMMGMGKEDVSTMKSGHAMILNEYGWLWLNRDGSPTRLTEKLYPLLVGPDSTKEERFAMQNYLLAGETEYFRTHRKYAGVLHFVYLTNSGPGGFTSDHFTDVRTLTLEPHFLDYVGQAFKPLGVCLNYWQPQLETDVDRDFTVLMVNDNSEERHGALRLAFVGSEGTVASSTQVSFQISALGAQSYVLTLHSPRGAGKYTLTATATASASDSTISRRWVDLRPAKEKSKPLQ